MKYILNRLKKLLFEQQLWEMANLRPSRTGLSVIVYVSEKNSSHGPRIKFLNSYNDKVLPSNLVTMTVSDNPRVISSQRIRIKTKDINNIKRWVLLNKQLLTDLWNGQIDEVDFVTNQQSIGID